MDQIIGSEFASDCASKCSTLHSKIDLFASDIRSKWFQESCMFKTRLLGDFWRYLEWYLFGGRIISSVPFPKSFVRSVRSGMIVIQLLDYAYLGDTSFPVEVTLVIASDGN